MNHEKEQLYALRHKRFGYFSAFSFPDNKPLYGVKTGFTKKMVDFIKKEISNLTVQKVNLQLSDEEKILINIFGPTAPAFKLRLTKRPIRDVARDFNVNTTSVDQLVVNIPKKTEGNLCRQRKLN